MSIKYVIKSLANAFLTLIAVTFVIFCVLRMMPGDILEPMAREEASRMGITYEEAYDRVASRYNYNPKEPIFQQFGRYAKGLLKGDLGTSVINPKNTVVSILSVALPWTISWCPYPWLSALLSVCSWARLWPLRKRALSTI